MSLLAGVDIGGTKCAVVIGQVEAGQVEILGKMRYPTQGTPQNMLAQLVAGLVDLLSGLGNPTLAAVGVSCGGPLDSSAGLVLSPPNLPGWDRVDVLQPFRKRFGKPAALQNDANASALAEWRWGAGRGSQNMVFITMGTGLGAGLILNGRLYSGTNGLAGEAGHIRLAASGPSGYGKAGSFEGFCSGAGIAVQARAAAEQALQAGKGPLYCPRIEDLPYITAERVAEAARQGDPLAQEIFTRVGQVLGRGLAVLVDLLNPQRIVVGSIYTRQRDLLEPAMKVSLQAEALPLALSVCQVVPAELGESIGDYAALAVADLVIADRRL